MSDFQDWCRDWQDTEHSHRAIFNTFNQLVNEDEDLKEHRDFIEEHEFGYGDRPYHYMWDLLVREMPDGFKFLEIGVYQGQVLSLVTLLGEKYDKEPAVIGITPLGPSDDAFSKHPDINYEERIGILFQHFGLEDTLPVIIQGLSNDPKVIEFSKTMCDDLDMLYIDGNHNYDVVVSDIENYTPLLKKGGYLIMDDSANFLNIPDGVIRMNWRGLEDVSRAVRDKLETNPQFEHVFSVGHNRIWKKL
jgi:hypothetical protein